MIFFCSIWASFRGWDVPPPLLMCKTRLQPSTFFCIQSSQRTAAPTCPDRQMFEWSIASNARIIACQCRSFLRSKSALSLWNVTSHPVSVFSRRWKMLDFLRYRLLPPLMIIFFTGITQYLVSLGNPHRFSSQSLNRELQIQPMCVIRVWSPNSLLSPGNTFSWLAVVKNMPSLVKPNTSHVCIP